VSVSALRPAQQNEAPSHLCMLQDLEQKLVAVVALFIIAPHLRSAWRPVSPDIDLGDLHKIFLPWVVLTGQAFLVDAATLVHGQEVFQLNFQRLHNVP